MWSWFCKYGYASLGAKNWFSSFKWAFGQQIDLVFSSRCDPPLLGKPKIFTYYHSFWDAIMSGQKITLQGLG